MNRATILTSLLKELIDKRALVLKNPEFSESIIGFSADGKRVIYSYNLMVKELMKIENIDEDDAVDWVNNTTIPSIEDGEYSPIIMMSMEEI